MVSGAPAASIERSTPRPRVLVGHELAELCDRHSGGAEILRHADAMREFVGHQDLRGPGFARDGGSEQTDRTGAQTATVAHGGISMSSSMCAITATGSISDA